MKKLCVLGACLLALTSFPALAQAGGADLVVVKATESYTSLEFAIARAGSKPEYRRFKFRQLNELSGNNEASSGAAEATRQLLVELAQQGYSLTTTYAQAGAPTTLVFTKKQ